MCSSPLFVGFVWRYGLWFFFYRSCMKRGVRRDSSAVLCHMGAHATSNDTHSLREMVKEGMLGFINSFFGLSVRCEGQVFSFHDFCIRLETIFQYQWTYRHY